MNELNDKELFRVRLRFLDLIKSFFQAEPDAEKMSRWRGTFSALTGEQVNPLFDNAVREINMLLNSRRLKEIQDEYYQLFTDPFNEGQVNTMASHYIDGRSFGQTLVAIRGFLADAGLEKDPGVVDSEDSLVMLLDTFASLIEEEKATGSGTSRELQARLLAEYLEPFTEKLTSAVKANDTADFYKSCCKFLSGYLDLEKGLVTVS